jgi:YD repeat-containing protein
VIHPDSTEEQFERDAEGRLLRYTDALGRITQWSYSAAGLLTRRVDAQGNTLGYEWDKLGRLHTLINENERSTRFEHDPVGRLLSETGFDAQRTTYHYHSSSGVLAYKKNSLRVTAYDFDAIGRMIERRTGQRPGPNASPSSWQREHYAYDNNGRELLATNSEMRLQWFYDKTGNLIREHQHYLTLSEPKVAVWRHEYDVLNQRCTTTRPDGQREDVLRYVSGHVHGVLLNQR